MGCDVFANNDEIASKAGGNKVVAEFPDVCLSPPSPPAGPIPIPYPDTSFSKDMQSGSKTVKIKNQEIMLKDQSFYKSSPLGDEAATNGLGANVITHVITGKTYFVAWSMDVKFEGQNVDRHTDLTTSNHASQAGGTGPLTVSLAEVAVVNIREVKDAVKWARHVDPGHCGGNHDWECDKTACPDCWQPPCEPNAKKEQENYKAQQSGTNSEKARAYKRENIGKIKKKKLEPTGPTFENSVIDKIGEDKIESAGYSAHCRNCHMQGDIDIVTADSVIECKRSAKGLTLRQMEEKIIPIAKKCFPNKQIKVATRATELPKLENTLRSPNWAKHNLQAIDP